MTLRIEMSSLFPSLRVVFITLTSAFQAKNLVIQTFPIWVLAFDKRYSFGSRPAFNFFLSSDSRHECWADYFFIVHAMVYTVLSYKTCWFKHMLLRPALYAVRYTRVQGCPFLG